MLWNCIAEVRFHLNKSIIKCTKLFLKSINLLMMVGRAGRTWRFNILWHFDTKEVPKIPIAENKIENYSVLRWSINSRCNMFWGVWYFLVLSQEWRLNDKWFRQSNLGWIVIHMCTQTLALYHASQSTAKTTAILILQPTAAVITQSYYNI